jgi:hypothetical protein
VTAEETPDRPHSFRHRRADWIKSGHSISSRAARRRRRRQALQLLLTRRPAALRLMLPVLLIGAMAAIGASGDRAEHAMMSRVMPGDAADHGALQAPLGVSCSRSEGQRGNGEQQASGFHGGGPSDGRWHPAG